MVDSCVYHLDLVSLNNFTPPMVSGVERLINSKIEDTKLASIIIESMNLMDNEKLEIYAEAEQGKVIHEDDLLEMVVTLEEIVGGFIDGSRVEMSVEIPHSTKIWVKNGFDWDLTFEEEDGFEDDEFGDWEDPEWNDYE
jgi:hypothetical protein